MLTDSKVQFSWQRKKGILKTLNGILITLKRRNYRGRGVTEKLKGGMRLELIAAGAVCT